MKIQLLILMVLTCVFLNAQNKIESSIFEDYDSDTSTYQNSYGSDYSYDSNNNLISEDFYLWNSDDSSWELYYRENFTYNNNNKVTEAEYQELDFDTNQFVTHEKRNYSYNENNQLIERIDLVLINSQLLNNKRVTISYNGSKINVINIFQRNGSIWTNFKKSTFTYTGNNNTQTLREEWVVNQWVLEDRFIYIYNANDNITSMEIQGWDGSNWVSETNFNYTFDAVGNTTEKTLFFESGYSIKHVYAYDASSLLSNYAHPFKDKTGTDYETESFPYVNKILVDNFYEINMFNEYEMVGRTTYNYNVSLGVEDNMLENNKILFYPNPVLDVVNFVKEVNELKIYDVSGKVIKDFTNRSTNFDVSELNNGIYFMKGKASENIIFNQKLIKKD